MERRRRFTAEEKVRILREHLDNGMKISDLSEKYNIHPNVLRQWKKHLFEGALETFSGKHNNRNGKNAKEQKLGFKGSQLYKLGMDLSDINSFDSNNIFGLYTLAKFINIWK